MKKLIEIHAFENDYLVKFYRDKEDPKEKAYHTFATCDERIRMFDEIISHLEGKSKYKTVTAQDSAKLKVHTGGYNEDSRVDISENTP